jgi:hypothetical protein
VFCKIEFGFQPAQMCKTPTFFDARAKTHLKNLTILFAYLIDNQWL